MYEQENHFLFSLTRISFLRWLPANLSKLNPNELTELSAGHRRRQQLQLTEDVKLKRTSRKIIYFIKNMVFNEQTDCNSFHESIRLCGGNSVIRCLINL